MQIIPVIDIMGGIVVHAQGGVRSRYQPLQSIVTDNVEPIAVIRDLLNWFTFSTLYIADLDAIESGHTDISFYRQLIKTFPQVEFWLDIGIKRQTDTQQWSGIPGLKLVVGSESMQDLAMLQHCALLSLDFRHHQLLGLPELMQSPSLWPQQVIVMSLDSVGAAAGPDFKQLAQIQAMREDIKLYAAGGVRNAQDLILLKKQMLAGVLIASAIHNGAISREQLASHEVR